MIGGTSETAELAVASDRPRHHHRRRRMWLIATAVVVVAAVVVWVADPFAGSSRSVAGVVDNSAPTSLQTIARQNLFSQIEVDATLGYAGSYSVVNQAQGTVTSLPSVGQVVRQGQVLYQVSGEPVVLLYGSTPAYRSLAEGASASDVTGPDVQELNADLVALGYVTSAQLSPTSDEFGYWTKVGVEKLQAALGVTQNGTLSLGQAVFLPSVARITTVSAVLGGPAPVGQSVLSATSTTRQVTIDLDAAQQSKVKVGDRVAITLSDNQTTPGVVSQVGTVATSGSGSSGSGSGSSGSGSGSGSPPTVTVEVTPTDPAATGSLDQAPVQVAITTASVTDALVVPVDSLLALANGGYAVEVVDADGVHHLLPVALGLFDSANGLVAVTGSGLAAGQRVVVPAT